MIERTASGTLKRLASQFPVIGITGPRQSGKSTLARAAFPGHRYITFDDATMRQLAGDDISAFVSAFQDGVIFDEAQKVPEIFDAIKLYVDAQSYANHAVRPGHFILTGSSQFRLRANMTDSLAGRAAFLKLLPFSIEELSAAQMLPDNPDDLILRGQYPPLYDPEKSFIPDDWFESYIDTYLDLDVKDQIKADHLSSFRKFVQICALYSGQLLSMDSIARDVGVSAPTVKQWLSILENSFLIRLIEPETGNLGKSLVKTPKLYFADTGLLCHLLRIESREELVTNRARGAAVETLAVSELLKSRMHRGKQPNLTFYREHRGIEVDTIADWKHTFAIEIKRSSSPDKKLSDNIKKYLAQRPADNGKGAVFYLGDHSLTTDNISYVSWRDWGTYLI